MIRRSLSVLALGAVACGGSGGGGPAPVAATPPDVCSNAEQLRFVDEVMRDIYYWVDELPAVDPQSFATPEELLAGLIFAPLDRFSAIVDEEEENAFFSASQFIGIGMGIRFVGEELFVTQTFADGPAAAAGLDRGYQILAINGVSIPDIVAGEGVDAAFGPDEIGVQVDLDYRDLAGSDAQLTLFKDLVTIETISASAVFDNGGTPVAYLALRNFVEPSFDALAGAFADFAAAGATELVLDLRYNGGGLISVAEYLGGLLGGARTAGDVFARRVHNANNAFRDVTTLFADQTDALDLSRLIVITSAATASASELIVNSLEPFAEVVLIGERTTGKPVGSYGFVFCSKILRPISFANENALGFSDYFDGFAADCAASDDLGHALGDPLEASLAEALYYLANGSCSTVTAKRAAERATAPRTQGWRAVVNAY